MTYDPRQPVKIGIVGCGNVMRGAYMPQIARLRLRGLADVTMACSRTEATRRLVRDEYGIARVSADFREVVQADEVDLVLVLTSPAAHGPVARAALEAGKHVLVEKPMAVTREEAATLVDLAQRSPGYLLCAPFVVLSPTYQAIWHRLQQGAIGALLTARAIYGWAGPDWGTWFYRRGGGPLFDLAVYNLTTLTGLLGPARRVLAMAGVAIPEREIDGERIRVEAEDNAHVLLDFGAGRYAVVTTGFTIQRQRCPAVELYGSAGTLQMMGHDWAPEGYELWQNSMGAWQVYDEIDPFWSWTDGLRHLVECIHHGTPPVVTPEHAFHVLEIMVQAQASARDGQVKSIDSTFVPPVFGAEPRAVPAHLRHDPRREGQQG